MSRLSRLSRIDAKAGRKAGKTPPNKLARATHFFSRPARLVPDGGKIVAQSGATGGGAQVAPFGDALPRNASIFERHHVRTLDMTLSLQAAKAGGGGGALLGFGTTRALPMQPQRAAKAGEIPQMLS